MIDTYNAYVTASPTRKGAALAELQKKAKLYKNWEEGLLQKASRQQNNAVAIAAATGTVLADGLAAGIRSSCFARLNLLVAALDGGNTAGQPLASQLPDSSLALDLGL